MPDNKQIPLHVVDRDLRCLKCGHKGAVKGYGVWNPQGSDDVYHRSHGKPYMDHYVGFGGTIPWECTNCDNRGLEDFAMEGYQPTFERIGRSESK